MLSPNFKGVLMSTRLTRLMNYVFGIKPEIEEQPIITFTLENSENLLIEKVEPEDTSENETKHSSILFEFDENLKVKVHSSVNEEIIPELIKHEYFTEEQSKDENVIQYCFVLMANEVTEQIIMGVNDNEIS